jgi:hypothetical protein
MPQNKCTGMVNLEQGLQLICHVFLEQNSNCTTTEESRTLRD